jgi:hypothetical protein
MKSIVSISSRDDSCGAFHLSISWSDPLGHADAEASGGTPKSITGLGSRRAVTDAYVWRLLPLTCFASDRFEAVLEGAAAEGAKTGRVLGNGR